MLERAESYEALVSGFRWRIPARYNIADVACSAFAARAPEREALLHLREDGSIERWTYGRLEEASSRLANALKAQGVTRGERVALLLPQSPQTLLGHLAVYKLGAVAVPLANLFGVDALRYRLADSGAAAVITDAAGLAKLSEIRDELGMLRVIVSTDGAAPGALCFDTLVAQGAASFDCAETGPDDPAMMIYTSGTTGQPKGALHAHRTLLGHLPGVEFPQDFFPKPGDLFWTPADWAWIGGLIDVLLPSWHHGVPVLSHRMRKFDPEHAFHLIAKHGVRNAFLPPTALKMMRTYGEPPADLRLDMRTVASGGETLGAELVEWGRRVFGVTINEFYGQTECNAILASCAALGVSRSGAIGMPVPGHEVAVIGEDGSVLAPGAQGQIAVRRPDPVMFLRYWGQDEATLGKFIGDWMTTGDQGVVDEDGYVHFVGRDDDIITSAGYRIGPGEIEDCLIGHPAVAMAGVVGKPDPARTEIVKAYVVLADGHAPSQALASELQDFVKSQLAAHEYPREIAFVDALPMTTTGKIIRKDLRARAAQETG
jgi:acetyl-CoA synthetase